MTQIDARHKLQKGENFYEENRGQRVEWLKREDFSPEKRMFLEGSATSTRIVLYINGC